MGVTVPLRKISLPPTTIRERERERERDNMYAKIDVPDHPAKLDKEILTNNGYERHDLRRSWPSIADIWTV